MKDFISFYHWHIVMYDTYNVKEGRETARHAFPLESVSVCIVFLRTIFTNMSQCRYSHAYLLGIRETMDRIQPRRLEVGMLKLHSQILFLAGPVPSITRSLSSRILFPFCLQVES